MKQIIKKYIETIIENKQYFGFTINDSTFQPFEYKNVLCCASVKNKDMNHILTRLKQRTNVTLNDIFTILKRGIDEFLRLKNTKYKTRRTKSFHIISKSFPEFKLVIQIVKNEHKDIFKYIENSNDIFYNCSYICFLYTILKREMRKHLDNDELFVENRENENLNEPILLVE